MSPLSPTDSDHTHTGTLVKEHSDFVSDDAALIACLLRGWDVNSGIIGTAVGDDHRGRWVAHHLKSLGVLGEVRLEPQLTTPFEVNVSSDRTGARTYFWQRKSEVLATLDTADISLLQGSCLLYVDWYDGDRILRPMQEPTDWVSLKVAQVGLKPPHLSECKKLAASLKVKHLSDVTIIRCILENPVPCLPGMKRPVDFSPP